MTSVSSKINALANFVGKVIILLFATSFFPVLFLMGTVFDSPEELAKKGNIAFFMFTSSVNDVKEAYAVILK